MNSDAFDVIPFEVSDPGPYPHNYTRGHSFLGYQGGVEEAWFRVVWERIQGCAVLSTLPS